MSLEEAEQKYYSNKINISPRRTEYWQNILNCTAKEFVSKHQKLQSTRSLEHYTNKGYSVQEANFLISNFQNKNSINSIMNRLNVNKEEAIIIQSDIINKTINTKIERGICFDYKEIENFTVYKCLVWRQTNKNFRRYKTNILNSESRGINYHLDHKFSIYDGYKHNISVNTISNINNLEILSAKDNLSKNRKSSISVEEIRFIENKFLNI